MELTVGMPSRHRGMTLVEVLLSLVIFAIGMLGIANMLMVASKSNNSSYAKQQAIQCVYDIFDKIRSNSTAAISGNYNVSNLNSSGTPTIPSAPGILCDSSTCTPAQLAAYDTWIWLSQDVTKLPSGSGSITTAPAPGAAGNTLVTVTVQWDDSPAQNRLGSSSTTSAVNSNMVQLSVQTQL